MLKKHSLKPGERHTGPDYYKSSDSGHAPVIYRSEGGGKDYIVCHESDLGEAIEKNCNGIVPDSILSNTKRIIRFYTNQEAAQTCYRAMCQAQTDANRKLYERCMARRKV